MPWRAEPRYNPPIAVFPILTGKDNPLLRVKTRPVTRVTKDLLRLLHDMEETMKKAEGVGIAAPQIGQSLRVCLAILHSRATALINPVIIGRSTEEETAEEGCLSLPGILLPVPRARAVTVRFRNRHGQEQERCYENLDARIVQHEIDHLDGILIVDYSSMGG